MQQSNNFNLLVTFFYTCNVVIAVFFLSYASVAFAQSGVPYTVDIVAHVPGCGDDIIQTGEQCDGGNFGGASCNSLGFTTGTLTCSSVCTHVTTACVLDQTSGTNATRVTERSVVSSQAHIVVSGYGSPGVAVVLLKDAQSVGVGVANSQGVFQITVAGVATGNHHLQLVSIMGNSVVRSEALTVRVLPETTTRVTGIVLPPHLKVIDVQSESTAVQGVGIPGSVISVSGLPAFQQSITIGENGSFTVTVPSNLESISIATTYLGNRSAETVISLVRSDSAEQPEDSRCSLFIDRTDDCRINIVDFTRAVQAFLFDPLSRLFDFNNSGRVDIVDFSILAYYWTG